MLPIAGTIGALAVITLLRAGDRASSALTVRRSVRGPSTADILIGVVTAPWAIARSLLTTVLILPVAALVAAAALVVTLIMTTADSLPLAGSYAAGAAVAFYATGPGSGGARREMDRLFGAVARTRGAAAIVTLAMCCLAAAAIATAAAQPALYWPSLSRGAAAPAQRQQRPASAAPGARPSASAALRRGPVPPRLSAMHRAGQAQGLVTSESAGNRASGTYPGAAG